MSLTKKGSRTIAVENETYLWQVRKKPTYSSGLGWSNLSVAVQLKETNCSVLVATLNGPRPDAYIKESKEVVVTLRHVEDIIKKAIESGWGYNEKGSSYEFEYQIT